MKRILCGLLLSGVAIVIVFVGYHSYTHNLGYKNSAAEQGDDIILNGDRYAYVAVENYEKYTISDVLICETCHAKLYMIREYPDYEYIAVYFAWDGSIYKRTGSD